MPPDGWGGLAEVDQLERSSSRLYSQFDGGRLCWRRWGSGPALILLHGGYGSWLHWCRNIKALSRDFTVYALDLPGLGASDPAPEPHSIDRISSLIADGIDQVIGENTRFFLGAFSLGAAISSAVLRIMGDRVAGAVLVGSSGLGDMWQNVLGAQRRRSSTMTEAEIRDVIRENLGRSMIADTALIDEATVSIQLGLLNQKSRLVGLPISQSTVLLDNLPYIEDRVTLLWGEGDPYLHPDIGAVTSELQRRFPALEMRVVPGAGHWANFERAGEFRKAILRRKDDQTNIS